MRIPFLGALALVLSSSSLNATPWQHPLYLSGGDYWRARIEVRIENASATALEGKPVALPLGNAPGQGALVGVDARAIRVCNAQGEEMLFGVVDAGGTARSEGKIPPGATLWIPAECPPKGSALYYVYFDNPAAGLVPDFLVARMGLANGDVELGQGEEPEGWRHDEPDAQHRATWSDDQPKSGRRCLKTVVDAGAEPTWISTRQSGIHIIAGARYVMRAWVRAENVKGQAGWYIHVGNSKQPMLISPMLTAGPGSYGWKEVRAEFTAPAEADQADLGTVLRGTGTAWFDLVSLECLDPPSSKAVASPPQRLELQPIGADAPWPGADDPAWDSRAVVRLFHLGDAPLSGSLASVDLAGLEGRARAKLDAASIAVVSGRRRVPHYVCGNLLLFAADAPARSVSDYYVYFPGKPGSAAQSSYAALLQSDRNLVKNPSFEEGDPLPAHWSAPAKEKGLRVERADPRHPLLGGHAVKMQIAPDATSRWRGWQQSVPVRPGHSYLLAAWVKCEGVRGGEVRLHAHRHNAAGGLTTQEPMLSAGPGITGTSDWTLMSGLVSMPNDAASLRVHLTTEKSGTVWHDGVVVVEVTPAEWTGIQRRTAGAGGLAAWSIPAIEKVFPDHAPARAADAAGPVSLFAARNELEPLQWAIRSDRAVADARVETSDLVGPQGHKLPAPEVGVVGYVPIDHATSYYQSQTPAWHRKYPRSGAQSDGWPGPWPDPILPRATLDLKPGETQAAWITWNVPASAPAGDYTGKVRLVAGGKRLAETPVTLHVWNFSLPEQPGVKAIYDVSLGPGGAKHWRKSPGTAWPEIIDFMARRRTCPNAIQPSPSFQYRDGKATADFTEFDRAAEHYFGKLKLPHAYTPWQFYLFGWGFPPKTVFGEEPYEGQPPFEKADRSKLRPEYKRAYQACLKLFWDHVSEKGWQDRFVLYISDEPFYSQPAIRQQMRALCDMIHEVDRKIPIYSSTWHHVPDWDGYLDIWGIGHYGVVPPEQIRKIRQSGAKVWFTTDGQICTDTPYCAVERLLPHYCFHYGAEAYEFWSVAWLTYNPYQFGWHAYIHQSDQPGKSYWIRYPNGDGFMIYPGAPIGSAAPVSTVRFEQAREGVEDFEYLRLLQAGIERAKASGKPTAAAEQLLKSAAALVPIPNAGGRYSSKVLPDPNAVYRLRERIGRAIESLP